MALLSPPKAPALPFGPDQYDRPYFDKLLALLRIYFNQVDNTLGQVVGTSGATTLQSIYAAVQSNVNQTAASTVTAYPMTFTTVDYANGVSLVSGSRLFVSRTGIYNLQFSAQFANTDATEYDVDIWFRRNGVDIPASNSVYTVPKKHGGGDGHIIAALNFYVQLSAGDYVEIIWRTANTAVFLEARPAGVTPTRPSIPSVIATINYVSAI
jgi:hypothetical protein